MSIFTKKKMQVHPATAGGASPWAAIGSPACTAKLNLNDLGKETLTSSW